MLQKYIDRKNGKVGKDQEADQKSDEEENHK
jgi:hypothetical protein